MLALSALVILYGNRVMDHMAAASFTPSADVAQLHDELKLTGEGSDLLYASKPEVQTGTAFNESCQSKERTAAILGCYAVRKIYLYDVTNKELVGAEPSTAAHEMLHAAYDRLNYFERKNVDSLLDEEYQKVKEDPSIVKLMQYYKEAEPEALTNELHSILGTTIADLTPGLEQYYKRYFTDRQAVVQMKRLYSSIFSDVESESKQLSSQIKAMKPRIDAELASYDADMKQLDADIAAFNAQAKGGFYKAQYAFNAARQQLVNRVDGINGRRNAINSEVAQYNDLIAQLNALSVRVNELNSSINAAPAPSAGL